MHNIFVQKYYNHLIPNLPSRNLINLKKNEIDESQMLLAKKLEIYFYKLMGLKFIEEDEDFLFFWKNSVSIKKTTVEEGINLKETSKIFWNNFKDFNSEVKIKIENISAYSSCPG